MDFNKLDHARVGAGLLAAVLTGGAALYGFYVKARHEARVETAASYETLAPEINELKRSVAELEAENRRLRQAQATVSRETTASETRGRTPPRRRPASETSQPETPPAPKPPPEATEPPKAPTPSTPPPAEPAKKDDRVPKDFERALEIWKRIKDLGGKDP